MGDLVAVAEHFGHQRRRHFCDQPAQCWIACAQEVDSELPKPLHECVGVDMTAGTVSGEKPLALGTAGGAQVRSGGRVSLSRGERLRNGDCVSFAKG
jgi:hypothetical protein